MATGIGSHLSVEVGDDNDNDQKQTSRPKKKRCKPKAYPNVEFREDEVKLHVSGLPYSTPRKKLGKLFVPFGEVLEVFVFNRPNHKNQTRSAFVRIAPFEAGEAAMKALDGMEWKGSILHIQLSYQHMDNQHVERINDFMSKTKHVKNRQTNSSAAALMPLFDQRSSSPEAEADDVGVDDYFKADEDTTAEIVDGTTLKIRSLIRLQGPPPSNAVTAPFLKRPLIAVNLYLTIIK